MTNGIVNVRLFTVIRVMYKIKPDTRSSTFLAVEKAETEGRGFSTAKNVELEWF